MLLLFLLVSVISFAGSLHPGTVNLAVVQTTLSQNRRAGLWLALGGSLPEMVYSAMAAGGLMLIPMSSNWTAWLPYASVPVLLGTGLASFRQKPLVLNVSQEQASSLPFWKGMVLGSTNPQLLPFWSAVWIYLSRHPLVPVGHGASQWVFALGTTAGAFGLLVILVWLTDRQRQRIGHYLNGPWINRLTGGVFIAMALGQLFWLIIY